MSIDVKNIRKRLQKFDFSNFFTQELGWEHPNGSREGSVSLGGENIPFSYVAQLKKIPVLSFEGKSWEKFQNPQERKKLHGEIKKQHEKHLAIFSDGKTCASWSYLSENDKVRVHDYFKGQNGDALMAKLVGIHIGIGEKEPSIKKISENLEKSFNTEKVTKKFYDHFKKGHLDFQKYISGMDSAEDKGWYVSVILNRLMFIWFVQKKGFIDGNRDYLKDKLCEFKNQRKNYYEKFLKILFFEGFAKKPADRSCKAKRVLGNIKYLNGGLFVPHPLEDKYGKKIKIRDKAFDKIFEIFSQYDWHAEDSRGQSNEIDPNVLGHIFEKYINDVQKKSMGAFYTRNEITGYLSGHNIHRHILDKVNEKGYSFESVEALLYNLNAPLCKLILTDKKSILNTLTILDPAVGSGAFLVAAMKELIDIYSPIIGKIETMGNRELDDWLKRFEKEHKSISYGIKKSIILNNLYGVDIMREAVEVCKLRLFLALASAALEEQDLEPLPNIDFNIMGGNSLVGFLKDEKLRQGDLFEQRSLEDVLAEYRNLVERYKREEMSFEELKNLKKEIRKLMEREKKTLNALVLKECREKKIKYEVNGKKRDLSIKEIERFDPFHWDVWFGEIIDSGGFDIILTNPPWDKVKLEVAEFLREYDPSIKKKDKKGNNKKLKKALKDNEKNFDYMDKNAFYKFQRQYFKFFYKYQTGEILQDNGTSKQSSADMDCYRLFMERCIELIKKTGRIGIVIPSGLTKDDGSVGLRYFIFNNLKMESLIDFQNQQENRKGRIFEGLHPQFTFVLANLQNTESCDKFYAKFGARDLKLLENFPEDSLVRSIKKIKKRSPLDWSIIEFKHPLDEKILLKAEKFPSLRKKINDSWNVHIYREFDETNDKHLFSSRRIDKNYLPLYKGGAIYHYEYDFKTEQSSRHITQKTEKVQKGTGFAFKNKCYKEHRLVFRHATRTTNERTLIFSLIPKNSFFTNTLNAVHVENVKNRYKYLALIQAFFNSFTVDYFLRLRVPPAANKKYLVQLHIPRIKEGDLFFNELVKLSASLSCTGTVFNDLADEIGIPRGGVKDQNERWQLQAEIDAMVAHIYGLTKEEYAHVLSTVTTGRNEERREKLKKLSMEEFEKINDPCKKAI